MKLPMINIQKHIDRLRELLGAEACIQFLTQKQNDLQARTEAMEQTIQELLLVIDGMQKDTDDLRQDIREVQFETLGIEVKEDVAGRGSRIEKALDAAVREREDDVEAV